MSFFDARGLELVARTDEVREMERKTLEDHGLPGRVLMELAGAGTARAILDRVPDSRRRAVVLVGPGGNGGDGYVIARHLRDQGWEVRCLSIATSDALGGDTAENRRMWDGIGGETLNLKGAPTAAMGHHLAHANVIVDALLGMGQARPLDEHAAALVALANEAKHGMRVAVDVPTGVDSDTGALLGMAFEADLTTTYGVAKAGLFQGAGARLSGEVLLVNIGLPRGVVDAVGASYRRLTRASVAPLLPDRPADGHKGTFGHVAVVGGAEGLEGAAVLSARSALRSGAGLVTWNRLPGSVVDLDYPEVMTHDASRGLDGRSDVILVGPGLGSGEASLELLGRVLADSRPLVVDADALNGVAAHGLDLPSGCVLTPHPGEAARLLGTDIETVQTNRLEAARALVERHDATVVLKGAGTLIATPGEPTVIHDLAAPALAVGGSGDVLAGVIAGLRAQGVPAAAAAMTAVWLHGHVGLSLGRERLNRGTLPQEIADGIPAAMASLLEKS